METKAWIYKWVIIEAFWSNPFPNINKPYPIQLKIQAAWFYPWRKAVEHVSLEWGISKIILKRPQVFSTVMTYWKSHVRQADPKKRNKKTNKTKKKNPECINSLHKSSEERGNISMSTELSFDIRRRLTMKSKW